MTLTHARLAQRNIAVALVNGHFIGSIYGRPTPEIAATLESFVRSSVSSTARFGYYLRIGEGASPPDDATRERLRELGTKLSSRIVAVSTIIEIPGFLGAAVRGVVTGMSLFLGRTVKIRASSNVHDAVAAVDSTIRDAGLEPLDAATLEAALADLRAMG